MKRKEVICKLINEKQFKNYVEVGTWKGETTEYVIDNCPSLNKIFGIDPLKKCFNDIKEDSYKCRMWEPLKSDKELDKIYDSIQKRFSKYGDKFTFLRNTSEEAVKNFDDGSLDFVFIDAIHLYRFVKQDIGLWLPKVKKGCILAGHDYSDEWPEVKKAVNEFFNKEELHIEDDNVWWIVKQK